MFYGDIIVINIIHVFASQITKPRASKIEYITRANVSVVLKAQKIISYSAFSSTYHASRLQVCHTAAYGLN